MCIYNVSMFNCHQSYSYYTHRYWVKDMSVWYGYVPASRPVAGLTDTSIDPLKHGCHSVVATPVKLFKTMEVWMKYGPNTRPENGPTANKFFGHSEYTKKIYYYGELCELIRLQSSHVALASQPTNAKHVSKSRKNDSELWSATPM